MAKQSTKKLVGWFLANLACVAAISCSPGVPAATADDVVAYRPKCAAIPHLSVHPEPQQADDADRDQAETETKLRRLRQSEVTRAHGIKAKEILNSTRGQPFGAEVRFELNGKSYAAVIEHHYHEPGGEARPWGWHRGISLFAVEPVS
jgi:hypothetical protein